MTIQPATHHDHQNTDGARQTLSGSGPLSGGGTGPATRPAHSVTRVDFAFGAADRLLKACEVTRKQVGAGRRLLVYTRNPARLAKFDRLLWQFDATAFVPHVALNDPLADRTPVLLTADAPGRALAAAGVWLLNLDTECPPDANHYLRILEIVSHHPDDKAAARQRWRTYQETGLELRAFDISGS
ncbi:MAG: DNA polymerase III subunit chi [Burkholderiaceae bacterium]